MINNPPLINKIVFIFTILLNSDLSCSYTKKSISEKHEKIYCLHKSYFLV